MYAKIINNKLEYFSQEKDTNILGDLTIYALSNGFDSLSSYLKTLGFKEVIYSKDSPGLTETEYNIIIGVVPNTQSNDDIKALRQEQYKISSDSLYIAWQKYLLLGELDKAEQAKLAFLNEINRINIEFSYI